VKAAPPRKKTARVEAVEDQPEPESDATSDEPEEEHDSYSDDSLAPPN